MKKIISASFLAVLTLTMLLPVAGRVNATSVTHSILRQGTGPMPGSGGGGQWAGGGGFGAGSRVWRSIQRRPHQRGDERDGFHAGAAAECGEEFESLAHAEAGR